MKKQVFFWVAALLLAPSVRGQSIGPSTINATGGSATIGGNTYEYSIGEMAVISTFSSANLTITQGVLQPQDATTGIGNDPLLAGMLNVYPNPAGDVVYVRHSLTAPGNMVIFLQDVTGKELLRRNVAGTTTTAAEPVSLAPYAAGTYMLTVMTGSKSVSYKIQKNH